MPTLNELYARKNRLIKNGKNDDSTGVLRKIERDIRKAKKNEQ